jgi:3-deoxy-manno-octulosonate cytidylyltransferase (CMP-KDO synthetase)
MKTVAVIPARLESSRLPGKVLKEIAGKPMIQWVYEAAGKTSRVGEVHIATDSPEVELACRAFGASVIRTSPAHRSGTDRVAEAAAGLDVELVLNVQADEPLLDPDSLDRLALALHSPGVHMASLMAPIVGREDFADPNVVKVVCDLRGKALYFSRSPIPYPRIEPQLPGALPAGLAFRHIGVYGYRREALMELAALPPAPLERAEGLEQLRALGHGWCIQMVEIPRGSPSVDTEDDLIRVQVIFEHALRASAGRDRAPAEEASLWSGRRT